MSIKTWVHHDTYLVLPNYISLKKSFAKFIGKIQYFQSDEESLSGSTMKV